MTEQAETSEVATEAVLGRALARWRKRAGWSQAEVARRVGISRSYLSKLEGGRKRPSPQLILRFMAVFRSQVADWTVTEAVDAWLPLGIEWRTVDRWLAEQPQLYTDRRALHHWWRAGRPPTPALPPPIVPQPLLYGERTVQAPLQRALQQWADYRKLRYQAHVVWGRGGLGKTTLVQALLAEPELQRFFRAGIFWIAASGDPPATWVGDLCAQADVARQPGEDWAAAWQRWTEAPQRRALVVVDDVGGGLDLAPLLAGWGPQMVVLLTTQQPDAVGLAVRRWLAESAIREQHVGPLNRQEIGTLAERVWQRAPTAAEWVLLQHLRWTWSGAPCALLQAVVQLQQYGAAALAQLPEAAPAPAVARHLACLRQQHARAWQVLSTLVRQSLRVWPFTALFAATVWRTSCSQAAGLLAQLQRLGVVERLAQRGAEAARWQIPPEVWRWVRERWATQGGEAPRWRRVGERCRLWLCHGLLQESGAGWGAWLRHYAAMGWRYLCRAPGRGLRWGYRLLFSSPQDLEAAAGFQDVTQELLLLRDGLLALVVLGSAVLGGGLGIWRLVCREPGLFEEVAACWRRLTLEGLPRWRGWMLVLLPVHLVGLGWWLWRVREAKKDVEKAGGEWKQPEMQEK